MDLDSYALRMGVINAFVIFCSLILHQALRAYIADRLGDTTPRLNGRVTINPAPHIDPLGTIVLPLAASFGLLGPLPFIGWAKWLPLNPSLFRRGRLGHAIVLLAGPILFFTFALVGVFAAVGAGKAGWPVVALFEKVIGLNIALGVISSLPIPPIEISRFYVLFGLMSGETYARASFIGQFVLLLLLIFVRPFQMFVVRLVEEAATPYLWLLRALSG
jgi:hypothetical protein